VALPQREPLAPHPAAIFLAYSYRWVRPRDDFGVDRSSARFRRLSPVRRQLLGEDASPHSHWGLGPDEVPLRVELGTRGLLDPACPSPR
jgi:ectoine hydroxylase